MSEDEELHTPYSENRSVYRFPFESDWSALPSSPRSLYAWAEGLGAMPSLRAFPDGDVVIEVVSSTHGYRWSARWAAGGSPECLLWAREPRWRLVDQDRPVEDVSGAPTGRSGYRAKYLHGLAPRKLGLLELKKLVGELVEGGTP